ncbi:unnamed protein product [Pleuronectes platessa]|uniref:Uncharacterized protein n=1 Tax=Pleuronectes platessa TaxID=8262 RepID=A0A9N7YDE0_PLEPL|nr:unnamed protein product [Pleuronectes platessa]
MAERRVNRDQAEDDLLPVYLARPGTADQVPRQKYGGLFSSVEGAFDSKTIDFDALSVGQRGSRTPRTGREESRSPARDDRSWTGSERGGGKESARVEIRSSSGKEVLQNLEDEKVRRLKVDEVVRTGCRLVPLQHVNMTGLLSTVCVRESVTLYLLC